MNRFIVVMLLVGLCAATAGAEEKEKPALVMPSEVILTSGRVLRQVQVIRWEKDRVVLKHAGGADPIAFSLIKSITAEDLAALQKLGAGIKPMTAKAPAAEQESFIITGQAYDKGTEQVYKFVSMTVGVYPAGQEFRRITGVDFAEPLPKALVETTTDADGRFSINVPAKNCVLYARALRSYRVGTRAVYEWKLPLAGPAEIMLNGANANILPLNALFIN